jgi:hypothetical protein
MTSPPVGRGAGRDPADQGWDGRVKGSRHVDGRGPGLVSKITRRIIG